MDKIKTIIADDDYLVRSYLKMLPSWERAEFEIVADVRDGEEALEALDKTKASLLITDISMPLTDGIELIRKVRRTNQELYIIVLSCHDEFEYVKDAMKEGADEYVLKNTLDENTLYDLLISTKNKMQEKKLKYRDFTLKTEGNDMIDASKKYQFFNGVLVGTLKGEERERARMNAGILATYKNSAVIVLFLEEWEEKEERWTSLELEQYCQDFLVRFQGGLSLYLEEDSRRVEAIYLGKGIFCCFQDLSDIRKSSQMHQQLTSTATACYKICQNERYEFKIGVSNVCIGAEAIRQAYAQAREMVKFSFYDEREILYYDIDKKAGTKLPKGAENLLNSVEEYVYKNDKEGFLKECRQVIKEFEQELTERRFIIQWIRELRKKAGWMQENGEMRLYHFRQVWDFLEKISEKMFETNLNALPENLSKPVKIAAEFATKHYKEPIGLTDAALAAGVNSTYLSYLFQKEMKIGFANFLLNQRMECAQEMLKRTNLKVREVAQKAGFNDYHYFAKAFKKKYGMSPAQYRKEKE